MTSAIQPIGIGALSGIWRQMLMLYLTPPRAEAILRLLFGVTCTAGGSGLIILLARGGGFAMPALLISLISAAAFIISYWIYYYC